MMNFAERIDRIAGYVDRPLWYICYVLLFALTIVAFIAVVMRYGFGMGEIWVDEICRYSFIAIVYLWAGPIVRTGEHIRLDVIINRLGQRAKYIHSIIVNILLCITCIALFIWGIFLIQMSMMMGEKSDSFVFNIWWIHAVIATGMFIHAFYAFLEVLKAFAGLSRKQVAAVNTEVKQ